MRIFDRYLLREIVSGWLAVTVVLWLVLVSNRLVRYLADAAEGDIPAGVIFHLLALKMLSYLVLVLPFALALGVVLGLGRLYRDNEMVVMAACGVGPGRIYRPVLAFGLLVMLLLGWLSLVVSPQVQGKSDRLKVTAEQQADLTVLGAGRFNELQDGALIFYAERLTDDRARMENLLIVVRDPEQPGSRVQLLKSRAAYRTRSENGADDYLVLVDGYRYEGTPGEPEYRVMQFDEYGVRVDLPDTVERDARREAVPTSVLLGSADPGDIAELQWRLALPISVIGLLLLAVPLSSSSPRQGRYGRLVLAILLFVIYYNLLGTAKVWVSRGVVPQQVGLWWVTAMPVVLAFMLYNGRRLLRLAGARS